MKKQIRLLYAGDSPPGGAANYLLGVINSLKISFEHVPPGKPIPSKLLKNEFSAFVLSDYSKKSLSASAEKTILKQVDAGAGLMMVGGWASFSGPFGGWRKSQIEKALPVSCQSKDDRLNFPGGAHIIVAESHPIIETLSFKNPPVICGMNDVQLKPEGQVILEAARVMRVGNHLVYDNVKHPLLVVNRDPQKRIAAFMCDFAPHWCGGMVDWGQKTLTLKASGSMQIQVGDSYVRFAGSLLRWLMRLGAH